jgi:hypothetical protein
MPIMMPPTSIQTALSVGEPVKARETLDVNELLALMPMTVSTTPPTRSAVDIDLFIIEPKDIDLLLFEFSSSEPFQ